MNSQLKAEWTIVNTANGSTEECFVVEPSDDFGYADHYWTPSDEAQAEIQVAADPEAVAIAMCEATPERGYWS